MRSRPFWNGRRNKPGVWASVLFPAWATPARRQTGCRDSGRDCLTAWWPVMARILRGRKSGGCNARENGLVRGPVRHHRLRPRAAPWACLAPKPALLFARFAAPSSAAQTPGLGLRSMRGVVCRRSYLSRPPFQRGRFDCPAHLL